MRKAKPLITKAVAKKAMAWLNEPLDDDRLPPPTPEGEKLLAELFDLKPALPPGFVDNDHDGMG